MPGITYYERNRAKYAEHNRRYYEENREFLIAKSTARKTGETVEEVLKRKALRRAAPEMLAALRAAKKCIAFMLDDVPKDHPHLKTLRAINAAIAKATGDQS